MKSRVISTVFALALGLHLSAVTGPETTTSNTAIRSQIVRWFENIDLPSKQTMNESIDLSFVADPDGKVHLQEVITANHVLRKLVEDTFNQLILHGILPPDPQRYHITIHYQVV